MIEIREIVVLLLNLTIVILEIIKWCLMLKIPETIIQRENLMTNITTVHHPLADLKRNIEDLEVEAEAEKEEEIHHHVETDLVVEVEKEKEEDIKKNICK